MATLARPVTPPRAIPAPTATPTQMVGRALVYVVLLAVGLILFTPFILAFLGTFKTNAEIIAWPPRFFPAEWRVENWPELLNTDVGGLPRAAALEFIESHERAERGWYAAPVGWFDSLGNGQFVVALRSGLIHKDQVHLYAGAGIVQGSDALEEFDETEIKLRPMKGALGLA